MALPPSLAALLARDDFATIFESGRCARGVGAASDCPALAVDRLLASLDEKQFRHRPGVMQLGRDFQLGRVTQADEWEQFDGWQSQYMSLSNSEKARAALDSGYSLTIRHAEWRIPRVFEATAALQRETGAPIQANIYVTPPNARGVKPHADRHDVYAWQVAGAKTWLVREADGAPPPVPPRENRRGGGCELPGAAPYPVERAIELRAGDCLYVPRGVPHQCRARSGLDESAKSLCTGGGAGGVQGASGGEPSIHVSFGSDVHIPLTWEGALHCALKHRKAPARTHIELHIVAMSTCPRLRRSCPLAVLRARCDGEALESALQSDEHVAVLFAAADEMGRLAAEAADCTLWRAGLPGRAADWLSRPTNGVLDFVPLGPVTPNDARGLDFLPSGLGPTERVTPAARLSLAGRHSPVGPTLVALRELTAEATRNDRIAGLLDVFTMAYGACNEVQRGGAPCPKFAKWGGNNMYVLVYSSESYLLHVPRTVDGTGHTGPSRFCATSI